MATYNDIITYFFSIDANFGYQLIHKKGPCGPFTVQDAHPRSLFVILQLEWWESTHGWGAALAIDFALKIY